MNRPPRNAVRAWLVCGALAAAAPCSAEWNGTHSGTSFGSTHVLTCGDNILTVEAAYVWDNGEGKSPTGEGSDWGMAGPLPWKHGPFASLHLVVYSPTGEKLHHTRLFGVWMTGDGKYEWKDDEGLYYTGYGIYDWDWSRYDHVTVRMYESDPGWLRGHDILMEARVDRLSSALGVDYKSLAVPVFRLRTRDLESCPPVPTPVEQRREPGFLNRN